MSLDCRKVDAIADAVGKISSRFDCMISRKDEWSTEAREAAAKARGGEKSPKSLSEKKEQKNYERDLRPEHEKSRAYGKS